MVFQYVKPESPWYEEYMIPELKEDVTVSIGRITGTFWYEPVIINGFKASLRSDMPSKPGWASINGTGSDPSAPLANYGRINFEEGTLFLTTVETAGDPETFFDKYDPIPYDITRVYQKKQ